MEVTKNKQHHNYTKYIETHLEKWFLPLPSLSKNARESIVTVIPWISLILGILGLYATIKYSFLVFYSPLLLPVFAFWGITNIILNGLLGLISYLFLVLAFSGTKKRLYQGWKFIFWSILISIISSLLSFSLIGILIEVIILYLVFQVKSYYK